MGEFPVGRIDALYLHWTGADDRSVFESYHYCIARAGSGLAIVQTRDPRANMRDIRSDPALPYAAHTLGRNSYALGIAVAGMLDATPSDFGPYPLRDDAIEALCYTIAHLAMQYAIPIEAAFVMTHAEAAAVDGYFGVDPIEERWDLGRLHPEDWPIEPSDARHAGDTIRARAVAVMSSLSPRTAP